MPDLYFYYLGIVTVKFSTMLPFPQKEAKKKKFCWFPTNKPDLATETANVIHQFYRHQFLLELHTISSILLKLIAGRP